MKALATSMILLLLTVATGAEEAAKPAIPAAYPEGRYGAAWSKNPFLLRVKHPEQTQADVLRDWALNGMAEYDGKVQVTIVNKQTGEFKRLTNHDGADAEFRLI
ncbi:MAG: hypothetical protein U0984_04530, partial [Prosthecobacter sp.]|nr:hypothetical protein [Prosthecobacter sp.]